VRYEEMSPAALMRAATRRRINEQYLVNANKDMGRELDRIAKRYPHLNAATAMTLAENGYTADSPEVKTVGELQAKRDSESSWWGDVKRHWTDKVENVAKPFVRTALTALNAPIELEQAKFRTGLTGAREGDLGKAVAPFGLAGQVGTMLAGNRDEIGDQTRLGSAIEVSREAGISVPQALNNNPQMGTDQDPTALLEREQQTWLPGPNALAEKRQVVNARNAGQVNGRATTFGRTAGWVVGFDPGGAAHTLMSRMLDMSNNPMLEDNDRIEDWINYAQAGFEGGVDFTATMTGDPVGRWSVARSQRFARGAARVGRRGAKAGTFTGRTVDVLTPYTRTITAGDEGAEVPVTVNGLRKTVVYQNAADIITKTKQGDRWANYLAAETDYNRMSHVLGRDTHPSVVLRMLAIRDPAEAKVAFLDAVGSGFINRTPSLTAADLTAVGQQANRVASIAAATTRRPAGRWRQLAPSETVVSRDDPAWAVEQYRRMLNAMRVGTAKDALTPDFISKNVEEFARGVVDDGADWSVPYTAAMEAAKTSLVANNMRKADAEKLTTIWQNNLARERHYWIDQHTRASKTAFVTVDGDDLGLPKAASSAEMFTEGIPLINTQAFNRAASRMSKLYQSPGWEGLVTLGDFTTAFFKFMVLPVRGPAWMIRNLSEAQARITVMGMPGIFNDPLGALAWRLADNPRSTASRQLSKWDKTVAPVRELRRANGERHGVGQFDAAGDDFRVRSELEGNFSQFAKTQEHKGGPWHDENRLSYTDDFAPVNRDERGMRDTWLDGHRFTLAKLSGSPEYRMAIDAETPLHAKNMFWKSKVRTRMAQREPSLNTREGADFFMDRVYERIEEATGGNPALRDAIRQGRIDGVPLITRNARGNMVYNKKAILALDRHADDLPEWSVAPKSTAMQNAGDAAGKAGEFVDRTVFASAFALFGSMPNNRFVNSPLFRQLHWEDAERLMPLATKEARAQLITNARKARMSDDVIRRMEAVEGPAGKLDVEDIRELADAKAFTRWMDVVYNSHNKGNWTRSIRMISPFAAAVADMYRFWSKRLVQNPLVLHRIEQGMHSARQSGFVYNDENGEERFAYPLTRGLSQVVAGVDRALTGTVKGGNMITSSLLPGVGPVVSWPVAAFLPDTPATDDLREIINPYGDPDASGGILEGFTPSHVQRFLATMGLASAEQQRRYQESVADAMAYLGSTGEYGNSEKEQERLRSDAERKGRALYLLQAFAQSSMPASPRGETNFLDPTGRVWQIAHISADYRKMMNEDPDTATHKLLTKYGEAAFLAVTGGTYGSSAFTTEEAHDLAREHPEVVDRYGDVWSYFTDENSPYSHEEYRRQLKAGERDVRTLKERQVAAQTTLAWNMYFQYKDQFGPFPKTDEQGTRQEKLDYLQAVKAELRKEFPLWDESYDANEVADRVKQTFRAANDPTFRDTQVADAIRLYGKARKQVRDYYNKAGITDSDSGWGKAKGAEEGRDYLRSVAESLVEQVPQFEVFWQRVFDSEMVDDVEGTP
jgi:hypothetical protein